MKALGTSRVTLYRRLRVARGGQVTFPNELAQELARLSIVTTQTRVQRGRSALRAIATPLVQDCLDGPHVELGLLVHFEAACRLHGRKTEEPHVEIALRALEICI